MARFYANIQGNRGEATRMGTAASGISGHIRGWEIGASVDMDVNEQGEDVCTVTITHGSGYSGDTLFVGRFVRRDGAIVKL